MEKILYYVVEREVNDCIDESFLTGLKTIRVYDIVDNKPKLFCEIETLIELSSENEIQVYLDNNGYENDKFKFIEL